MIDWTVVVPDSTQNEDVRQGLGATDRGLPRLIYGEPTFTLVSGRSLQKRTER